MVQEENIIDKIVEVVRQCGKLILEAERSSEMVDEKEGHANFVTTYDRKVQRILKDKLLAILPEAVFVGEEDDMQAPIQEGFAFIVEPIDGTTNFIKDYHASCISVGLARDAQPYIGVVYNPYLDEMYTAQKGKGAFCNGKQIHVSKEPLSNGLVVFGMAPYYEDLVQPSFDLAQEYFRQSLDIRRSGSAAIDLCSVAAGRTELFFELMLSPWDYAAGALLVQEAGGIVTTVEGKPRINVRLLGCGSEPLATEASPVIRVLQFPAKTYSGASNGTTGCIQEKELFTESSIESGHWLRDAEAFAYLSKQRRMDRCLIDNPAKVLDSVIGFLGIFVSPFMDFCGHLFG